MLLTLMTGWHSATSLCCVSGDASYCKRATPGMRVRSGSRVGREGRIPIPPRLELLAKGGRKRIFCCQSECTPCGRVTHRSVRQACFIYTKKIPSRSLRRGLFCRLTLFRTISTIAMVRAHAVANKPGCARFDANKTQLNAVDAIETHASVSLYVCVCFCRFISVQLPGEEQRARGDCFAIAACRLLLYVDAIVL